MQQQDADKTSPRINKKSSNEKGISIALCLSGGGFRATFFHLGVIEGLRQVKCRQSGQTLLERVSRIYSVSGGSILAAHLALNWECYTGSEEDFQAAASELKKFGQRNIRGRIVARWFLSFLPLLIPRLFPKISHRIRLLEREYEALYGGKLLGDLRGKNGNVRPDIYILTTSFNRGVPCAFSGRGFYSDVNNSDSLIEAEVFPVARAVAASSAFPAMFPPVELPRDVIAATHKDLSDDERLTDGGVFDNLGIECIADRDEFLKKEANLVAISDASLPFKWDEDSSFNLIPGRTVRVTDIMMKRVSDLTNPAANSADEASNILQLSILPTSDDFTNERLEADIQKRIPKIRTDLDRFSEKEQDFLIRHGKEVCVSAWAGLADPLKTKGRAAPPAAGLSKTKAIKLLDRASRRKTITFNPFDWATYGFILLVAAWIAIPSYLGGNIFFGLGEEQANQEIAKTSREMVQAGKVVDPANPFAEASSKSDNKRSAVVVIRFAGYKRDTIKELGKKLVEKEWRLPYAMVGGERTPKAANLAQVRYADNSSDQRILAEALARDIRATSVNKEVVAKPFSDIRDGVLEVWIGLK